MKTFQEFMSLCEASDSDAAKQLGWGGGVQLSRTGDGGRIGKERKKTTPEIRRTKAVGGGKVEPTKPYAQRKDVGQQRGSSAPAPGRSKGGTTLKAGTAGTQGSAAMSPKEIQRKAYLERKAREKGASQPKTASQAISQTKPKPQTSPDYKPHKPSGLTAKERNARTRAGEKLLKNLVLQSTGKKSEKELKHRYTSR